VALRSADACRLMPTLLAARASGRLGSTDLERVERHLSRCGRCREAARRREEAEQAYGALLGEALPGAPAPAAASEPFAPGDPEPDVLVRAAYEGEGFAEEEDFDVELLRDRDHEAPPTEATAEHDVLGEEETDPEEFEHEPLDHGEEIDPAGEDDWVGDEKLEPAEAEPRLAFDGWSTAPDADDPAPARRGRAWIVALILVGVVIFAIGLVQLLGDDGGSSSPQDRASRPAARAPTPTAAPAPAPSRADLRFRARLRSLGDRELGPGTTGDDVKALQKLLGVQQTGTYGELTTYAVKQFQTAHGLTATGVADKATKRKLARRTRPPKAAPTPPASSTSTPPAGTNGAGTPTGTTTAPPASTTTAPGSSGATPGQ
jgi:hypothetical protein